MDLQLQGLSALITGGSKGIGFAVADRFAREGCHLHLAARNSSDLDNAKKLLLKKYNVNITTHSCDLSNSIHLKKLSELCHSVDILVNNAGAIPQGDLLTIDETLWRNSWELKVFGYINLTREIYRQMKSRRKGVIINIIGTAGERPTPGYIAGTAANASLMAFSKALGGEGPDHGIRVIGVNPGLIETDRQRVRLEARAVKQFSDASKWPELVANAPMGRLGQPNEVADVVAFFASGLASYVSGTIITVDAGRSARHA